MSNLTLHWEDEIQESITNQTIESGDVTLVDTDSSPRLESSLKFE